MVEGSHNRIVADGRDRLRCSLGDGIVLMTVTTLLSEPFALYPSAQFAGYPLHELQVAIP